MPPLIYTYTNKINLTNLRLKINIRLIRLTFRLVFRLVRLFWLIKDKITVTYISKYLIYLNLVTFIRNYIQGGKQRFGRILVLRWGPELRYGICCFPLSEEGG